MICRIPITVVAILITLSWAKAQTESPLGLPTQINDIYIPGGEVVPIPRKDFSASLVVRLLAMKDAQDGHRYDFEVYGLDPGTHALKDYLHYRADQSPVTQLTHTFIITTREPLSTLPAPAELTNRPPSRLGGYRVALITLGVFWLLVLLGLIFYRKKKDLVLEEAPDPTLAERLEPLVTAAAKGDLSIEERANLERLIFAHWKDRLPDLSVAELRRHPDSSPLLLQLENWLHAPNPSVTQTEIAPLLSPFATSSI